MRIHIAALGGTIASTPTSSGGVSPTATGEDIAAAAQLHTLAAHAGTDDVRLTCEQLAQVGSGALTLEHLVRVVESARRAAEDGAAAVVVTQGTDTLEETAFVLSRINDSGIPIVVTGAMRNPTVPGADGPANVRCAVMTALSQPVRTLPCVVAIADEIHDPVFVRKAHTSVPSSFTSGPSAGPLGWVSEDRPIIAHMPAECRRDARPQFPGFTSTTVFPQVAVVTAGLGDPLHLLSAVTETGYAGCVIAGVGGGHVPESALPLIEKLAAAVPVVYTSRTGSGAALERTYGYPGGEIGLRRMGLVPAGVLDPAKARLHMRLALAAEVDVAEAFERFRS